MKMSETRQSELYDAIAAPIERRRFKLMNPKLHETDNLTLMICSRCSMRYGAVYTNF